MMRPRPLLGRRAWRTWPPTRRPTCWLSRRATALVRPTTRRTRSKLATQSGRRAPGGRLRAWPHHDAATPPRVCPPEREHVGTAGPSNSTCASCCAGRARGAGPAELLRRASDRSGACRGVARRASCCARRARGVGPAEVLLGARAVALAPSNTGQSGAERSLAGPAQQLARRATASAPRNTAARPEQQLASGLAVMMWTTVRRARSPAHTNARPRARQEISAGRLRERPRLRGLATRCLSHSGLNRPHTATVPMFRSPMSPGTDGNGHRNIGPSGPRRASTSGGSPGKPRGRCGIWDRIGTLRLRPRWRPGHGLKRRAGAPGSPLLGITPSPPGGQATRRCSLLRRRADASHRGRQVGITAPGKPVDPFCAKGPPRGATLARCDRTPSASQSPPNTRRSPCTRNHRSGTWDNGTAPVCADNPRPRAGPPLYSHRAMRYRGDDEW